MSNLPTLRQIQYLIAVSETGSFHGAATACNVTQSTLSAGIREMESILDYPVINRTTRSVSLSPLGEDYVREGRAILERLEALAYNAKRMKAPLSWPIRLGIIPTIAPYLLPTLLPPLQKALPDLQLHISEARSADLLESLRDGSMDIAILAFPYDTKDLNTLILKEEPFFCAAPKGHFKDKPRLNLKDLEGEKLLLLEDGHCLRDHALAACKLQPDNERKTFKAASLSTLIQMVAQGYGITLLPEMVVKQGALPKGLDILPFTRPAPVRQIGLAWPAKSLLEKDIALVSAKMKHILDKD